MSAASTPRVVVIGAGVSGIAAANVWKKCGYEVTVFEASARIGGQWARSYPGVRLQNTSPQYVFADFGWPFAPDRHPTGEQVVRYMNAAVEHFGLDVRLEHRVVSMEEDTSGWTLRFESPAGETTEHATYVVLAVGQYPADDKYRPRFPGEDAFPGSIVHGITSREQFRGQRVVVLGNGKTALDMVSLAGATAERTVHVFRTPRWTIPDELLGIDFTRAFFSRFGSVMMPSWVYPSAIERGLHHNARFVVASFWRLIAWLFRREYDRKLERQAIGAIEPAIAPVEQFVADLRSASALVPDDYHRLVASGRIELRRGELVAFTPRGVELGTGEEIECDSVVLCLGNQAPSFPYLPAKYRALMEDVPGGRQLYRHLIHPDIPRLGFAGFNHGFLHIALVEMGTLWQVAALRGELQLPSPEQMHASMARVTEWKARHQSFEATGNYAVNTRFQQYLDVLLKELGVSPYRKLPNPFAELFTRYGPDDYRGVVEQYLRRASRRARPLASLALDT